MKTLCSSIRRIVKCEPFAHALVLFAIFASTASAATTTTKTDPVTSNNVPRIVQTRTAWSSISGSASPGCTELRTCTNKSVTPLTITKLKGTHYWDWRWLGATQFPPDTGNITVMGNTPTTLTTLAPLNGVNLGWVLYVGPTPSNGCYFVENRFINLSGNGCKATFGYADTDYKWKWTVTLWIKNGLLYFKAVGKNVWNQDLPYGESGDGCDWSTKTLFVALNIDGGGILVNAAGTRTILYKTIVSSNWRTIVK